MTGVGKLVGKFPAIVWEVWAKSLRIGVSDFDATPVTAGSYPIMVTATDSSSQPLTAADL